MIYVSIKMLRYLFGFCIFVGLHISLYDLINSSASQSFCFIGNSSHNVYVCSF